MLTHWNTLSILTAIHVLDYYNDKARLQREQLHEYAVCFHELGKNIEEMGTSINRVLQKSRRYDFEQDIIKGEVQLPAYLFMKIVRAQQKPASQYQRRMIDIYFNTLKGAGLDKDEYLSCLRAPNAAGESLYERVGITRSHCGSFWSKFIELLYEAEDGEEEFERIVTSYAESCFRFALLGECDESGAEAVFREFADGLQEHLRLTAQGEQPAGEEKLISDLTLCLTKMRENCRAIDEKLKEEERILMEMFDYFAVSMVMGLLEAAEVGESERADVLQYFLDSAGIDCGLKAEAVYQGCQTHPGVYKTFYESANQWKEANFWQVHQLVSGRAGVPELTADFAELALDFLRAAEFLLHHRFPNLDLSGKADQYMKNVIGQMGMLVSGNSAGAASQERPDKKEQSSTAPREPRQAEPTRTAAPRGSGAAPYEEIFARRIEQYAPSKEPAQKKTGRVIGIAVAAVLFGILILWYLSRIAG